MRNGANNSPTRNRAKKTDPLSVAVNMRTHDVLRLVRQAIEDKSAMLAFQPIVDTEHPYDIAFYEGLIRIMDRTGRIIPAREFISVVETDEIGRKIDCISLQLGFEALAQVPSLRLAINMSARSIGYKPWTKTLERGLRRDPKIGERLILEISEHSAMILPEVVQAFMSDQQSQGVAFALDNFGAGNTAFRHLKDFYFDIIKIDGQFIRGIHSDPNCQIMTNALISIAKHFDMFTVAEMVENEEDANFLTKAGIDCMQGYYFGVPTINPYWKQDSGERQKTG